MAISKRDIVIFLFKHKGTILGLMAGTVALVTLAVYAFPQSFTATSRVLVERTKVPTLRTETQLGSDVGEAIFDAIEIARSRTVMDAVVDQLALDRLPVGTGAVARFIAEAKATLADLGLLDTIDARERWIRNLSKHVDLRPALDTNVFTISFSDQNPQLAADIVNAVTDAYLANHMRVYSYDEAVSFYRENMVQAKHEMERIEGEVKRVGTATSIAAKAQGLVQERVALSQRVAELRLELADVQARFAHDHPKVRLARSKIASTQSRLLGLDTRIKVLNDDRERIDSLEVLLAGQEETYRSYKRQYDQALLNAVAGRSLMNVHVLDHAAVPQRPRYPRIVFVLVSVIAGLGLGLGAALVREFYDHRVDSPRELERLIGSPVVGVVGRLWRMPY